MKTQVQQTPWQIALARWLAISHRATRLAKQHRSARQRLAHQLLMRAKVGDALCAHNWGAALPGDRGMLCQRALTLLNDWRGSDFAERVQAMAWNKYMHPQGAPKSNVKAYRPKEAVSYVRAA